MSKRPFLASVPGIIGSCTLIFALAAAGVLAFLAPGPRTELVAAVVILMCIGGAIFTVGLSVLDHPRAAVGILIFLPPITLYHGLIQFVPGSGAVVGGGLLGAAAVCVALTLRGNVSARVSRTAAATH